jgi:hypothetical protein
VPARQELARIEAELATAETDTNVIELHPQAVELFKQNLEALADILVTKDALPDLELVGTFRSLVESVVVRPGKAGEQYEVNVRGYLANRATTQSLHWFKTTEFFGVKFTVQNQNTALLSHELA